MLSKLFVLFAVAAVLAAPAPADPIAVTVTSTGTGPNPTQVYINGITYGGSGCPQGSMSSFISQDRQT